MLNNRNETISYHSLLKKILNLAQEKKAKELIVLDIRGISSFSDYFVICHGDSEPQVKAIADNIRKRTPNKPRYIEGYEKQNWVLIDYFDIVVHIFKSDSRQYYAIEKLWGDAPILSIPNEKT